MTESTEEATTDLEKPEEWSVDLYEDSRGKVPFDLWLDKETEYIQAVVQEAIERVLTPLGMDICKSEWGDPLGEGLYEFRIRQSLHALKTWGDTNPTVAAPGEDRKVLIRLFLTFHGSKIILLFHGYDKKSDPSKRRQQKEIKRARKHLKDWKKTTAR